MLFDLRPKESRRELFGRDEELDRLHRLVESEWVVIVGRRMTGKTSLLKTFVRETGGLYVNLTGVNSIRGLLEELAKSARRFSVEVSLGFLRVSWTKAAEDLFSQLGGRVVGLDEIQELPANYFLKLLKRLWDSYPVRLVMTGSAAGVMSSLLEPDPRNPMYGRRPAVLELKPFPREHSVEFLSRGFTELGYSPPREELEEAAEALGGYPGWLTYYGNLRCVRGLGHSEALDAVYEEGRGVMREELERLLSTRQNPELYKKILRRLPARWSELERALGVNKKTLLVALRSLEKAMLVEKRGSTYVIPDPVLRRLVLEL